MRVERPVLVHVVHRLYRAGAELLAADLARSLSDEYRFAFVCLDEVGPLGEELRGEGFEVRCVERRPGVDLGTIRRMAEVMGDLGPSLVHAHQYTPFFYASSARFTAGTPRVLFTEHGRHYPDRRKLKRVVANRFLLGAGDRVTAVGGFVRDALVRNEGLAGSRIEVVYNGIDTRGFGSPRRGREEVRRELGLGAETPVAIQVARFHPVKDHATALRSMAHLTVSRPDAVLLLVGDGECRSDLERQVDELGLRRQVRFLGVRDDVADLLAASDLFLLTSVSEGVSLTLLEAMSAGLPVVATDVGGNPEVVEDGVTGLLAGRGRDVELASAMVRLLGDASLRRSMGGAGVEKARSRFDRGRMISAYRALYDAMTERGVLRLAC
ncbi:glycosyltransferase [Mucisphaera calidilacus]|uniref:Glycosyltransferase EpsF n=1 Tax=Mucisphaera calidilacus TaxID=2527982 RepID=A0A518C118_9BACT|nr:glycosyltransferase [Mucisphaera calidilacus]QDU72921.1 Putative glycosyltransferase EpsF [Mucisphaera calidilacus]